MNEENLDFNDILKTGKIFSKKENNKLNDLLSFLKNSDDMADRFTEWQKTFVTHQQRQQQAQQWNHLNYASGQGKSTFSQDLQRARLEALKAILEDIVVFVYQDKSNVQKMGYYLDGSNIKVLIYKEGFNKSILEDGGIIPLKMEKQAFFKQLEVKIHKGFDLGDIPFPYQKITF